VFSVSQSLPGVIAINSSLYIGYKVLGFKGAVVAALGVILPSYLIIALLFTFLPAVSGDPTVQKAFAGVRAGVAAMILASAIRLGRGVLRDLLSAAVAFAAFIVIALLGVDAVWVILACVTVGFLLPLFRRPRRKEGPDA
jgi:chromate transporter